MHLFYRLFSDNPYTWPSMLMRLSPFTQFEFKELRNITIGQVLDCIYDTMNMIRPSKLIFFMEKIALLVCITMLLCQNYYSLMTYWQQDYIETKADAQLFNIDLPMIMICAENPFIKDLDPLGFDSKWEFIGWANKNEMIQTGSFCYCFRGLAYKTVREHLTTVAAMFATMWCISLGFIFNFYYF